MPASYWVNLRGPSPPLGTSLLPRGLVQETTSHFHMVWAPSRLDTGPLFGMCLLRWYDYPSTISMERVLEWIGSGDFDDTITLLSA